MTNCTQSWPRHLFWRCAIRQVAQSYTSWMQLTKMPGALLCLICLILRILALIHCLLNIWTFTYIYFSVSYFTLKTLDWDQQILTWVSPTCMISPAQSPSHWLLNYSDHQAAINWPTYSSQLQINNQTFTLHTLGQVPEGRPPALHCSFQAAPEDNC